MLIRISSSYFVAGYDISGNRIAPIIKYMKDWNIERIKRYCDKKKWLLEFIVYEDW